MKHIQENLDAVQQAIAKKAKAFEREAADIQILAVSKKQSIERVQAMLSCGHRIYGENRVQEAADRWKKLRIEFKDVELHLIGPLQTNKIQEAVELFDIIQTIDRPKLVKALAMEMNKQEKHIPCFVQVNTGEELQKSGVMPQELSSFLDLCREEGLNIIGLMCIPPQNEPSALHFAFLKKLADENNLKELSMGMSNDFEKAIPLGATYVRVGTALFGERDI